MRTVILWSAGLLVLVTCVQAGEPAPPRRPAPSLESLREGIALGEAIRKGDLKAIGDQLEANPDLLKTCEGSGCSTLVEAVQGKRLEVFKFLLEKGADPNATSVSGYTPLHVLAYGGPIEMADLLVARGAKLNAQDQHGWTPLAIAVHSGQWWMVDRLLVLGARLDVRTKTGETIIFLAGSHPGVLSRVLKEDVDLTARNEKGQTVLHYAASWDNFPLMVAVLERKADVNARDAEQQTPLHAACNGRHSLAARLLLAYGADPALKDKNGRVALASPSRRSVKEKTPPITQPLTKTEIQEAVDWVYFETAVRQDDAELVRQFVAKHPDFRKGVFRQTYGETALHLAATSLPEMMDVLLELGCDPNIKDDLGRTPLHNALSQVVQRKCIERLLAGGADVNVASEDGSTPLHVAVRGSANVVQLLLKAGAKVNVRRSLGYTPLLDAIGGDPAIIRALIKAGANVNARTENGESVLQLAKRAQEEEVARNSPERNARDIVELLEERGAKE